MQSFNGNDQSVKRRRPIGSFLDFRGMGHEPTNEQGVVALFSMIVRDLGMYIENIGKGYPDCVVCKSNGSTWERLMVEFEFASDNFRVHGHDPSRCDLIVCWIDNFSLNRPKGIQVLCLADEIKKLPRSPIRHPDPPPF